MLLTGGVSTVSPSVSGNTVIYTINSISYTLNTWMPIGYCHDSGSPYISSEFDGTFDGDGHAVSGLYINNSAEDYQGLFGWFCGTIKNLTVSGAVRGNTDIGGIAGYASGYTADHNWSAPATYDAAFLNCINNCAVIGLGGDSRKIGGIVGCTYDVTIDNCINNGPVYGGSYYTGGIAGLADTANTANCFNAGPVNGVYAVGGIAGDNNSSVTNCCNSGDVSCSNTDCGGISGDNEGSIENCFNTGNVSGSISGGLVGNNSAEMVTNCYWNSGSAAKGAGAISSSIFYGCGTFADNSGTITGGAADNSGSIQTLAYGDNLLAALNKWVVVKNSAGYCDWSAGNGINNGYPVPGSRHVQRCATQQPSAGNYYTVAATTIPSVNSAYNWYVPTSASPDNLDLANTDPGWSSLTNARPGGFGLISGAGHFPWMESAGVYTSCSYYTNSSFRYNRYSAMSIPVTVAEDGDAISFEWKVSSFYGRCFLSCGLYKQSGSDYVLASGNIESISGEVDWTQKVYSNLTAGNYYLVFVYDKHTDDDGNDYGSVRSVSTNSMLPGRNAAWLDQTGLTAGQVCGCTVTYDDSVAVFSDHITLPLAAVFKYNYSGAAEPYYMQEVVSGGKATAPATDPTRSGYLFGGWYTDQAGTAPFNFATTTITGITTVYAKWDDNTPPALSTCSPSDGAADVSVNSHLTLNFSENVNAAAGKNIIIKKASDDSTVETIAADSAQVSIVNNAAAITLSNALANGSDYYILIEAGAFKDTSNNDYAGISDKTVWNFTTVSAGSPVVSPIDASPNLADSSNLVPVMVDGNTINAGTQTTGTANDGRPSTTVTVSESLISSQLANAGNQAEVIVPVSGDQEIKTGILTGQMVKNMENKDATLEVKTGSTTYAVPAREINIDAVSAELGQNVSLSDINVDVTIADSNNGETQAAFRAADDLGSGMVTIPPVDFTITAEYNGKTVPVDIFNDYVARLIRIPSGVDPNKITTGVAINADGTTVRHIPTQVTVIDGIYYAKINSLTNSTYFVIWHPLEFTDVEKHWAKNAINDMGSRLVVVGVGDNRYKPDRNITRAEYAAIVVRALGLPQGMGENVFQDVNDQEWYCECIKTATSYGIISGYGNGNFGPNDLITREQAMSMTERAMKITGLKAEVQSAEVEKLLGGFNDSVKAADYAKNSIAACIKTGVILGRQNKQLAPKGNITRAEVATIVQRLLQKSNLI